MVRSTKMSMNELNNRFISFLNIVKCETKRNKFLDLCLCEQKRKIISENDEINKRFYQDLLNAKSYLNELCLSLNDSLVRERHFRIVAEWFSGLVKFEQDNLVHKHQLLFASSNEQTSSTYQFIISEYENTTFEQNLSNLSSISASQTSLVSCSSLSLCPTTSSETSSEMCPTDLSSCSSPQSPFFSLEIYLNNLSKNCSQLKEEYEKKLCECEQLKENVSYLNKNLDDLNTGLDLTRIENLNLSDKIKNLKKQIELHKSLKFVDSKKNSNRYDELWLKNEIDILKKDLIIEYEKMNKEELDAYESHLEEEFMREIDQMQIDYDKEADKIEHESNRLLNELSELNQNLVEDMEEYQVVREFNNTLNQRLIQLSSRLCSYSYLSQDQQDCLILNFSNKSLNKQIDSIKSEIKILKQELSVTERVLANDFILSDDLPSIEKSAEREQTLFLSKLFKKNKAYPFKLRPYCAQIDASSLLIKFDLIYHNYLKTNTQKPLLNTHSHSILSCLKIRDSIDAYSITLENSHKILDIDLSEWKLKREVYYANRNPEDIDFDLKLSELNMNTSSNLDSVVLSGQDDESGQLFEYVFPKGFKLKRRKKISLLATGSDSRPGLIKSKSLLNCNSLDEKSKKKKKFNES